MAEQDKFYEVLPSLLDYLGLEERVRLSRTSRTAWTIARLPADLLFQLAYVAEQSGHTVETLHARQVRITSPQYGCGFEMTVRAHHDMRHDTYLLTPESLKHIVALLAQHWHMHRRPGVVATGCHLVPEVTRPERFHEVELGCQQILSPLCCWYRTPRDLVAHYRMLDLCRPGYTVEIVCDTDGPYYRCTRCGERLAESSLSDHDAWHHQWEPYFEFPEASTVPRCRTCFDSVYSSDLQQHMDEHAKLDKYFVLSHPKDTRATFECRECAWRYDLGFHATRKMAEHVDFHKRFGSLLTFTRDAQGAALICTKCDWHYDSSHVPSHAAIEEHARLHEYFGSMATLRERHTFGCRYFVQCTKCVFMYAVTSCDLASVHLDIFQEHAKLHDQFDSSFTFVATGSHEMHEPTPILLRCRTCARVFKREHVLQHSQTHKHLL